MRAPPATSAARAVAVDPRSDPRWCELAATPGASLFTSPPWIAAICETYGFVPEGRVLVGQRGRAVDGLAWVRVSDARGDRLFSLPFSDRAEPFAGGAAEWDALVRDALASGLPLTVRSLDDAPVAGDPRFRLVGEAAWHGLPLTGALEEVHARASAGTRRNLRAAASNGLRTVAASDLESLRCLHRLHVGLRKRKYRMLAQPFSLFERIWSEFASRDGVLTVLAWVDDRPIAGALYLVWNDALYYKFGASIAEELPRRPNEAIHWTAIRWAKERGLRLLDWGLSDLDQPGLLRFKRKWGSVERRIVTLRAGGPPVDERGAELGEVLRDLTRLLTDDSVPDEIAAKAGAVLYRYFC
jgi:CelD/BcsL family acetyltransferase involved in cellulose biosynthesis